MSRRTLCRKVGSRRLGSARISEPFKVESDADSEEEEVSIPENPDVITNFPSDNGFVLGARLNSQFKNLGVGSFNDLAIRYGSVSALFDRVSILKAYRTLVRL